MKRSLDLQRGAQASGIPTLIIAALSMTISQSGTCLSSPVHSYLTLGNPTMGGVNSDSGQIQTKLMEQIMSNDVSNDFELSISTLNRMAASLEAFVKREQIAGLVGSHGDLMSLWSSNKGGSSLGSLVTEFDLIMSTFWTKFRPLIEMIITQRPSQLGQDDLDFRCRRVNELRQLREMSAQSSIYSMYLDIFHSDIYLHCLQRKLALIKSNRVSPSGLLKQFVDIYLDLPTSRDPMRAASKELQEQATHQILAGHAINFKLETALARHGPLSVAAKLVFDPRTALSLAPDSDNVAELLRGFESDCLSYNTALAQIWGEFDAFASSLSTQTCNLMHIAENVKLVAPQLVYGSICGQLLKLPR